MKHRLFPLISAPLALAPAAAMAVSQQCNGLSAVGGDCTTGSTDLTSKIGTVISTLLTVAGAVAVIIIVIGGIRYITSTGDSSRIKSAKDTILYAIVGLVIVILAKAIVGFVAGSF